MGNRSRMGTDSVFFYSFLRDLGGKAFCKLWIVMTSAIGRPYIRIAIGFIQCV